MNDDLEKLLHSLRPAPLPLEVRESLANPPDLLNEVDHSPRGWWCYAAAAAALVAVCAVVLFWRRQDGSTPQFAASRAERLVDARPLGIIDGSGRAWEIVELEFHDEEAVVGADGGLAMLTTTVRRQLVPVELHFD